MINFRGGGGGGGLAQTSSTESQIFIISAKLKKKRDTLEVFEADWQWASNLPIPPAEGDLPGTVTTSSKHAEPSTSGQDSDGDEHHTELPRKQENSGCQDNSTDRPSGAYSSEPCTRPSEGDLPGAVTTSSKHAEPSTSRQDSDGDEHHTELPRKQENSGCQDNSTDKPSGAYSSPTEPCTRPSEGDLPGAVTTSSKHAEPSTSRQDSDGDEHHTELPRKQENSGCQDNSTDRPSGAYSSPAGPCSRPSESELPVAVNTSSEHAKPSTSGQDSDGDERDTELPRNQESSGCQDNSTDKPSGAYSSPAEPCSRPSESDLPVAVTTSSEHAEPSTSGQDSDGDERDTELPRNQESSGCQDNSTDRPSSAYSSPTEPCTRPSEGDLPGAVTTSSKHAEPSTSGQDSDGDERSTELPRNQESSGCQDNSTDRPSGAYSSPAEPCSRPSEGDLPVAVTTSSNHAEPSTSGQDSDGDEHHTELPRKQENSGCQDNSTDRPSGAYSSEPCTRPSEGDLPGAVTTSSKHAEPSTSRQDSDGDEHHTELPRKQENSGCQDNSTDKPSGAYSSPTEPCTRPSEGDLPGAVTTSSNHAESSTSEQDSDGDEHHTELPRNQESSGCQDNSTVRPSSAYSSPTEPCTRPCVDDLPVAVTTSGKHAEPSTSGQDSDGDERSTESPYNHDIVRSRCQDEPLYSSSDAYSPSTEESDSSQESLKRKKRGVKSRAKKIIALSSADDLPVAVIAHTQQAKPAISENELDTDSHGDVLSTDQESSSCQDESMDSSSDDDSPSTEGGDSSEQSWDNKKCRVKGQATKISMEEQVHGQSQLPISSQI